MDNEFFLYNKRTELSKFKVVGLLPSTDFQKCRFLVEKLHICYPKIYEKPEIRGMLNLDWDEYLTEMKRTCGKAYYLLFSPVVVYLNGNLLGDDKALTDFVTNRYSIVVELNFEEIAEKEIIKYFENIIDNYKRKFVFLTIAIDEHVVGSMLFMLYNDLVPETCKNFMKRCVTHVVGHGYKSTKIHRIEKYSWIQCGGTRLQEVEMCCENYTVPHNRRGVLSMCNKRTHSNNSTQFFITLNPTAWMDYNYVAFGQLVQGAEILNSIERIPTTRGTPDRKIEIVNCGEFSLCPVPDEEYTSVLNPPYEKLFEEGKSDDVDSVLLESGYTSGKYCLPTDLKGYLPFARYSQMYNKRVEEPPVEAVKDEEEKEECECDCRCQLYEAEVCQCDNESVSREASSRDYVTLEEAAEAKHSASFYYGKHVIF